MQNIIISTDSACDLSDEYVKANDIKVAYMTYFLENEEYGTPENPIAEPSHFYAQLRDGEMPKTSQINPDSAYVFLSEIAENTDTVVHIAFSSGLSGTYNSFCIAADRIKEDKPKKKIFIVDSKTGSLGQGLMVSCAVRMRNKGRDAEFISEHLERFVPDFVTMFTVDDLSHLYRGGRISKSAMIVGAMVGIKPLLHAEDGKVASCGKVRGRRKALDSLVERAVTELDAVNHCKRFAVSHGDCLEDAIYVAEKIKEKTGVRDYMLDFVGPVLGTHAGPGVVALFFFGKKKTE